MMQKKRTAGRKNARLQQSRKKRQPAVSHDKELAHNSNMNSHVYDVSDVRCELANNITDRIHDAYATHGTFASMQPMLPSKVVYPLQATVTGPHTWEVKNCPFRACEQPHVVRVPTQNLQQMQHPLTLTRLIRECKSRVSGSNKHLLTECGQYQAYLLYVSQPEASEESTAVAYAGVDLEPIPHETPVPMVQRRARGRKSPQQQPNSCWRNGTGPQLRVRDTPRMQELLQQKRMQFWKAQMGQL